MNGWGRALIAGASMVACSSHSDGFGPVPYYSIKQFRPELPFRAGATIEVMVTESSCCRHEAFGGDPTYLPTPTYTDADGQEIPFAWRAEGPMFRATLPFDEATTVYLFDRKIEVDPAYMAPAPEVPVFTGVDYRQTLGTSFARLSVFEPIRSLGGWIEASFRLDDGTWSGPYPAVGEEMQIVTIDSRYRDVMIPFALHEPVELRARTIDLGGAASAWSEPTVVVFER